MSNVFSNVITSLSPFVGFVESIGDGEVVVRVGPGERDTVTTPDPNLGGAESGLYSSLGIGTAVLCQRSLSASRQNTFITSVLPTEALKSVPGYVPDNAHAGFSPYPVGNMRDGECRLVDDTGSELFLRKKSASIANSVGGSISVHRDGEMSGVSLVAEQSMFVTSAGSTRCGSVMRLSPEVRGLRPKGNSSNNVGFDTRFIDDSDPIGFFQGSNAQHTKSGFGPRNVAVSEYRHVVNEFSSDYGFLGIDIELLQSNSGSAINADAGVMKRLAMCMEPGSNLLLAPHELIEVIAGNVVDIYGNRYDINFGKVLFGASGATVPTAAPGLMFERAKRVSRRGLGYHFQLSTNIGSADIPSTMSNFSFALDKEGIMKLNVPKSSSTGNVPFVSETTFYNESSQIQTSFASDVPKEELIPITLRGSLGNRLLPAMGMSRMKERGTGVRYTNNDSYFPDDSDGDVRVNHTKYHNMCAAAEKLIANTIEEVIIPETNNECGFVYGNSTTDGAFERNFVSIKNSGGNKPKILHMAYAEIEPGQPAINSGGGKSCIIAGKKRSAKSHNKNPPFTNSFELDEDLKSSTVDDSGSKRLNSGGKSANINFEGAIDVSIGKDETDEKSFVLDTAGSLIAWFGADVNNRSVIMQTDGAMLVNVGGSINPDSGDMNIGRFDLRVNVTDHGYVGDGTDASDYDHQSDYMISIGPHGLVIAGCKSDGRMVIRNAGDLMLESGTKIIMSAPGGVRERTKGRPEKDVSSDPKSSDTPGATIPGVIDKMECISDVLDRLSQTIDATEDQ